jgi:23S rRNA pseudouridine1911/1915/1917 synthase
MADQARGAGKREWRVPSTHRTIRVDAFARRCLSHLSRREVAEAIARGFFVIDGRPLVKGERLSAGAAIAFHGPEDWLLDRPRPEHGLQLPIIYDDASVVAVNKPAGVPSHGFSGRTSGTVANFLIARFPELAQVGVSRWEPGLVHRLDIETSGVVLAAKTPHAFNNLKAQLRRRQIRKLYWALVWGETPASGVVELPLEHDPADRRRMRTAAGAGKIRRKRWAAITHYRRIDRLLGLSFLEVEIKTGVTHQIRVHLSAIGHPLVGDSLYNDGCRNKLGLAHHFLHARSLALRHPENGGTLNIEAELPADLAGLLKKLGARF